MCNISEAALEKYTVNPVLVRMKESEKGVIYQSIVAMGFRARQINDQIKQELTERMEDVVPTSDESEGANFDQLTISRDFDKLPKPTFYAMREMEETKLRYKLPEPDDHKIK